MSTSRATTSQGTGEEFAFSNEDFAYLTKLVYDECGITLGENKRSMVYSRLSRRLRSLGLGSFSAYCGMLRSEAGAAEMGELINAITTNLTRFYRERHHFDHLRDVVVPEVKAAAQQGGKKRLRIWSAGCSSGEEPYTIAITLLEAMPDIANWDARILATDLDTNMVQRGQSGRYPAQALTDIPPHQRTRYFQADPEDKTSEFVAAAPRKLIAFKQLNLLGHWPMSGPFDAIFCRNVMIYFDNPTKSALLKRYAQYLKPNGWLYIGHSESLLNERTSFTLTGRCIYRKKT